MKAQTELNRAPVWSLTEIAVKKGQELARKYSIDEELVAITLYLAHSVFCQEWKGAVQINHPQLSAAFAEPVLDDLNITKEDRELVLNAIRNHHSTESSPNLFAEVVRNAECFKFVTKKGALIFLHELGARGVSYEESENRVLEKMNDKFSLLSLKECIKEATEQCNQIKAIFDKQH